VQVPWPGFAAPAVRLEVLWPGFAAPAVRRTPLRRAEGKEKGKVVAARRGLEGGSGVSMSKLLCSWPLERRELCERLERPIQSCGAMNKNRI